MVTPVPTEVHSNQDHSLQGNQHHHQSIDATNLILPWNFIENPCFPQMQAPQLPGYQFTQHNSHNTIHTCHMISVVNT